MRLAPVALGPTGQDRIGHGEGGRAPGAKEQERPDGQREGAPGQRPADDLAHRLDRQDAVDRGQPVRRRSTGKSSGENIRTRTTRTTLPAAPGHLLTARVVSRISSSRRRCGHVRAERAGSSRARKKGPTSAPGRDAAPVGPQRSDSTHPVAIWRRKPRLLRIAPSHWVSGGEEDDWWRPLSSAVRLAIPRCAAGNAKQDRGPWGPFPGQAHARRSAAGRQGPIRADGSGIAIRG